MKQIIKILCFSILIILVCFNSQLVIDGASDGLRIWYNSLVPVILPFLLISGLFMSSIDFSKITQGQSILVLIICGLLCGYPVGAVTAGELYKRNSISFKTASALLPLCNNVSPMFLFGYIYSDYINKSFAFYRMMLFIYIPQILYAILYISLSVNSKAPERQFAASKVSVDNCSPSINMVLNNSIHTITIIGVYVMIFSIFDSIIINYMGQNFYVRIFSSFLEITKGTNSINLIVSDYKIKTALILSLTSFGGISAIFQSIHMLKESKLSLINYIYGKIICSVMTFILAYWL